MQRITRVRFMEREMIYAVSIAGPNGLRIIGTYTDALNCSADHAVNPPIDGLNWSEDVHRKIADGVGRYASQTEGIHHPMKPGSPVGKRKAERRASQAVSA